MVKSDLKLFKSIPTLSTERLVLRRMERKDVDAVYEYASDPEVSRYLLWYPHRDIFDSREYLKIVDRKYKRGEFYDWGITLVGYDKVLGTCGFTSFNIDENSAEIGYVLNRRFWGNGIASEAARAVITFGFEVLGLDLIYAKFIPENKGSRRVLEKCHMHYDTRQHSSVECKGRMVDVDVYSISRAEYELICKGYING